MFFVYMCLMPLSAILQLSRAPGVSFIGGENKYIEETTNLLQVTDKHNHNWFFQVYLIAGWNFKTHNFIGDRH